MAAWRMRIACLIPKATNTHSEYVIHIAFPPQKWLRERAPMLRYKYIAVCCSINACFLLVSSVAQWVLMGLRAGRPSNVGCVVWQQLRPSF